ncbi:MAG: prolyl-tRNA synthetase [Candidatus Peregrinibacteria bacterium Greene0416_62]|nr:MAG: prolyl-tRNA synthetase [Candidatus Peregrinibacteria bacterium Greene0416_62]TSC99543.1 MAG: prolyl-tRNA synthetase [Candidatus Peregrinibacteria bacterium Greene1014_49]
MLQSQIFAKTSKSSRADAESVNADLLTRAGFISKTMAGVYSFLPLGWRVLRNIENLLREEMDPIGAEVFLPSLTPFEQWEKTGRLNSVGILFQACAANDLGRKVHDAHYVLNSTHEEVITPLVQSYTVSHKDFPCAAYQIQTKFRNEARVKSGLLRCREFRMKDLYSFHTSEEDMLDYFFHKAIPAYTRFFDRVGLGDRTVIALASGGDFSKEYSREFQTLCPAGEDQLFQIPGTDTYYNREVAPSKAPPWGDPKEKELPRKDVEGKGIIGVTELAAFLKIEVERTTKTLIFSSDKGFIAAMVRGGYDINEEKLRKVVGCMRMQLASAEEVTTLTGAKVGYAGPIGLPATVRLVWDESTAHRKNFECGANETDKHTTNANFGRDVAVPEKFYDIKVAREGDMDPETGKRYDVHRAAEVGNVFTLYTKFSDAFGFHFTDKDGKEKPVYMGCYGIGTSRIMGTLAEILHDDAGLQWPTAVAPFHVHVLPFAKTKEEESFNVALDLAASLEKAGFTVLVDDRLDTSAGSRMADSDLIGIPKRIVISQRSLTAGGGEVKDRKTGAVAVHPLKEVVGMLLNG